MSDKTFSRQNPGCIIFVVDRSDSMRATWAGTNRTLAQGAAHAINKALFELCVKSTKQDDVDMYLYFYIGIYGYGLRPRQGGEGVESALPAPLASRGIVPLPELANHPLGVRDEPTVDRTPTRRGLPVWYEPAFGYRTPTCEAFEMVGAHLQEWVAAFPKSLPPVVCHLTDGLVTDSGYKNVDMAGWARKLTGIATDEGPTLLLNAFLSPSTAPITAFPTSAQGLPEPGPELFKMSSPLTERMISNAAGAGIRVGPGARGFVFNADLDMLLTFLEIGTTFDVPDQTYA